MLLRAQSKWIILGIQSRAISIGDKVVLRRRYNQDEVSKFAQLSGDTNPIHVNPEYAAGTKFGKPIVHALLVQGSLTAVFGTKFPGPGCVYYKQLYEFRAPLFVGEECLTSATVSEIKKLFVTFDVSVTSVENPDKTIMRGSSIVRVTKDQLSKPIPEELKREH